MHARLPTAVALAAACACARAATFTANQEADLPDLIPGNGFCNVFPQAGPGPCTLRAAIMETNALAGADTIDLLAGFHYTLDREGQGDDTAALGDLDLTDDLTIRFFASGERPVVSAAGIDRVLDVIAGNVTLLGFTISGGNATSAAATSGGGVLVRSGAGSVDLILMQVSSNTAELGGGLYNAGSDTRVSGSIFRNNIFHGDSTATPSGSAIRNRGNLEVSYSAFYYNSGIPIVAPDAPTGVVTPTANAIDSEPQGAGSGAVRIANSSLFWNAGTAINIDDGALELSSVTIAGNGERGLRMSDGSVLMHNSMIARNVLSDCSIAVGVATDTNRYNLDSDDTCALSGGGSNRVGVDPQLTPPVDHGGPTLTAWPAPGSIVIDHGHPLFTATGCEDDDQSLADRPVDFDGDGAALCDIGAVELQGDVIFFEPFDRI
ncbi:MAG TPA: choice-of-anchor Q domain-containing protein [Dokdonella sp.]|nr:choice-of-anchor Q domain-containing protein [Dokdonella sp.]